MITKFCLIDQPEIVADPINCSAAICDTNTIPPYISKMIAFF